MVKGEVSNRAARTPERYDVVRAHLRLLGPATPKQVAAYLYGGVPLAGVDLDD